jgi:hypothetical protein
MKFNRALKRINFFDNQLKNEMGNLFIEILESNKTLININLIYNRVQMKTIDEINRILKLNNEKQKAKFIPNLLRDIKGLQFNPELFKFYTDNIQNKKTQQEILYKKVREDDRSFTRLLNKENKKIDKKVLEMQSIQDQIVNIQKQIKQIKEKYDRLQDNMRDQEEKINDKIEEENKILKGIINQNSFLQAEYNSTKKEFENVIEETKQKQKISQDKLNLAIKAVESMTRNIKRKNDLLKNLMNPEMLIPIKGEGKDETIARKAKKLVTKKESTLINKTINSEPNTAKVTITSSNENLTTINSNTSTKNKEVSKTIIKKNSIKNN